MTFRHDQSSSGHDSVTVETPRHTAEQRRTPILPGSLLLCLLGICLLTPASAAAQSPVSLGQAAAAQQAPQGGPGSLASIAASLQSSEEENVFAALLTRIEVVELPDQQLPNIFQIEGQKKVQEVREVVEAPQEGELERQVKLMFQAVRVSSISITTSRKIAVVSYNNNSFRVRPGENVLGAVVVREIERDRVMFEYPAMPPIWIYRVRPGMPAPEVVFE